jgi:hypothetical protein
MEGGIGHPDFDSLALAPLEEEGTEGNHEEG